MPKNFDSWATVYSYHIIRELKIIGYEVEIENVYEIIKGRGPRLSKNKFDCALVILNNASKEYGISLFENIRVFLKTSGLIGTMSDHDHGIEYEDIRFCATLINPLEINPKAHQILWGCDPEVLIPNKDSNCLNIFLDSWIFDEKKYDRTPELLESCLEYAESNSTYLNGVNKIKIKAWGKTGVEEFVYGGNNKLIRKPIRIGFEEMMVHLKNADIFIVTHSESMGLTILEAAMAGCLVLIPVPAKPNPTVTRWIKTDLADTIPHVEIPHHKNEKILIPWSELAEKLLPNKIRSDTIKNTWAEVTKKILEGFRERTNLENANYSDLKIKIRDKLLKEIEFNLQLRERMLVSIDMIAWPEDKNIKEKYDNNWNILN
jgi:hypothetical protein